MIGDHPIVGVGLGAYPAYHAKYALRSQFDPTAQGFRDTHSTYLNLTAETGFIGVLLYFVSYITTLVQIDKVRRRAKKLLPATSQALYVYEVGTLGFFIAALFGSMAHVSFLVLHVIVTWALAEMTKKELAALRTQPSWNDGRVGSGGPVASAAV
jgi:O-antigen ligase